MSGGSAAGASPSRDVRERSGTDRACPARGSAASTDQDDSPHLHDDAAARAGDRRAVSSARLLAVAYDDAATAERALAALSDLADEHALALKDAAVVVRHRSGDGGSVEVHQKRALAAGEGVVGGGTIGLLIGLAIGLPVVGALVGIAGGGGASAIDTGISDSEMRRVGRELAVGRAALFALVADVDWVHVRQRLVPYGGEIVVSEVADDVLEALTSPEP
jgi:uncharacterized membrane protein